MKYKRVKLDVKYDTCDFTFLIVDEKNDLVIYEDFIDNRGKHIWVIKEDLLYEDIDKKEHIQVVRGNKTYYVEYKENYNDVLQFIRRHIEDLFNHQGLIGSGILNNNKIDIKITGLSSNHLCY